MLLPSTRLGFGIFMAIVYFKDFEWTASAEVVSLVISMLVVGIHGFRRNIYMWQSLAILVVYPISIGMVAVLKAAGMSA